MNLDKILDDAIKVFLGSRSSIKDARSEFSRRIKENIERKFKNLNFVSKEEFLALKKTIVKIRIENDQLKSKIKAIEIKLNKKSKTITK